MKTPATAHPDTVASAPRLPASGEVCSLVIDSSGLIAEASKGCRHLFERDLAELVGRPATEYFVGLERITAAEEGSLELHARRGARPCHVRLFWTREGSAIHALVVNLERMQTPFMQAASQARFGSLLTHELRNPLSSIKMVVQTFARAMAGDARATRRLSIAAREVRTIERILSALSDLTRRMPPVAGAVNVAELLDKVIAEAAGELAERDSALELAVEAGLAPVNAEPERLRAALVQLVCEAARMNPGSPLTLAARAAGDAIGLELRPITAVAPREFGLCLLSVETTVTEAGGRFEFDAASRACRVTLTAS